MIKRHEPGPILSSMVETDDMVYLCGMTAEDESKDIEGQTVETLAEIDKQLAAAGTNK